MTHPVIDLLVQKLHGHACDLYNPETGQTRPGFSDRHGQVVSVEELTAAFNLENAAIEALRLHVAYEAVPTDRGGSKGPKGQAWKAYIEARNKVLNP